MLLFSRANLNLNISLIQLSYCYIKQKWLTHRFICELNTPQKSLTSQQKRQLKSISFLFDLQTLKTHKHNHISSKISKLWKAAPWMNWRQSTHRDYEEDFPSGSSQTSSLSSSHWLTDWQHKKITKNEQTNHCCVTCQRIFHFNPNLSFSMD